MTFSEFLQDMALMVFCLLVLAWMTSCAYVEKNVYLIDSDHAVVEYTTRSATDVDAKDLADITGKLK